MKISLKKIAVYFYDKWAEQVVLDRKIVGVLADYSKLTKKEAVCMLKLSIKLDKYLWNILAPKTNEEIENFYKVTPFNVYTLAYWHMSNYQKRFRQKVLNLCKGRVLDFGGGIGDMSAKLKENGHEVVYAEVEGNTLNFADYFFKKSNHKIKMVNLSREKVIGNFDTILCIDVIEHVPNQKEVLKEFSAMLNKGGRLLITALGHEGGTEADPWHLKGENNIENYLNSIGLEKDNNSEMLWIKK